LATRELACSRKSVIFWEMPERLGELLIKKGKISQNQLDQAVQCQILFAGKLGTVLLELGYIGEKELAEALAERYNAEAVALNELKDIPADVIKTLPKEQATRYDLIAFRKLAKRLYVGMLDPQDKEAIAEVEKATGRKIFPYVVLEVYLRWALERYYGVKREARFIQLERNLELMRELYPQTVLEAAAPGQSLWRGSKTVREVTGAIPNVKIDPQSITALLGPPKDLDDFWDRVGRTSHPKVLLPKVKEELRKARGREEVARLILEFAHRIFARVSLFYIKGGVAFGWQGRGEGIDDKRLASLMVPLDLDSVLRTVYDTRSQFIGPLPSVPINQRMLLGLGGIIPVRAIVMPVLLFGKAAIILYADMGRTKEEREPDLASLQELLGEAQLVLQKILQESKQSENA